MVTVLLGVQHYARILTKDVTLIQGKPSALNSIFGFLVFGKVHGSLPISRTSSFFTLTPSLETF